LYYSLGEIIFELTLERPNVDTWVASTGKDIIFQVPEKFNEDVMKSIMCSIPFEWYWPNNETMTGLQEYYDCIQKIFLRSVDVVFDYEKNAILVKRAQVPKGIVNTEMNLVDGKIYGVINHNFDFFFRVLVFHAKNDGRYD
jgi:hypothetical protein